MMLVANYKTKKELKNSIGKALRYTETSLFGKEYTSNGDLTVIGPNVYNRKWYAKVKIRDNKIIHVS